MSINRILTDEDRQEKKSVIDLMYKQIPEMAHKKIGSAIVQQAFVFDYACVNFKTYKHHNPNSILSAGSYQDTAAELLRYYGFPVYDVDPVINTDLHTFRLRTNRLYTQIISTSVLEHTTNDEEFIADICQLLDTNGIAILTCDFKDDWKPGQPVPYTSNRFYTRYDLEERLRTVLRHNDCDLVDEPDYSAHDTFVWDGINYSFATYVFKKG